MRVFYVVAASVVRGGASEGSGYPVTTVAADVSDRRGRRRVTTVVA